MKKIILLTISVLTIFVLSGCVSEFDSTETINVYTRDTESGTREAFFKGIGFEDAAEDDALLIATKTVVSGNSDMISKIKADQFGMGYISLSSLESSGLTGLTYNGIEATETNVLNDTYGLKRPFNYMARISGDYISVEVENIVAAIVAYLGTQEGKAIIIENGGVVEISNADPMWSSISSEYLVCSIDNSSVDINIGGSTSVGKIAKAITADFKGKCGNFNPIHNHEGSSAAYKGTQKADTKDDAATKLDLGFSSRGFKDTETGAPGTYGNICWDAVVAVVNESNTMITNITGLKLKQVYEGSVPTWDKLIK